MNRLALNKASIQEWGGPGDKDMAW